MKFEIRHEFAVGLDELERVMFHEDLPALVKDRVDLLIDMEQLDARRDGDRLERRVRYLPYPMIKSVGVKKVEPEWMEWIEESSYDFSTHSGQFRNVPVKKRIAAVMLNSGQVRLESLGPDRTARTVSGELTVKVFMVGKVAERLIHSHARNLLDQEAAALSAILSEKLL